MIGVKVNGGLGNQLFQYAFIYATAKKLNTTFYLDETTAIFKCDKYFSIEQSFWLKFWRNVYQMKGMHLLLRDLKATYFKYLKNSYQLKNIKIDGASNPQTECEMLEDNSVYEGFFQSATYFKSAINAIEAQFTIRKPYLKAFQRIIKELDFTRNIVCIHIRKGDYVQLGWDLPFAYYHKAIKKVTHPQNFYIFISDSPEIIASEFAYIDHKYVSTQAEIIDFQFLLNSNVNILSNSSFSWWGTYLNKNKPLTIAPKYWLGNQIVYPNGIHNENWQLL